MPKLSRWDRLFVHDLLERFEIVLAVKRRPARQDLVENRPQAVDVGGRSNLAHVALPPAPGAM